MKKIFLLLITLSFFGCTNLFKKYEEPTINTNIMQVANSNNKHIYATSNFYLRKDSANLARDRVRETSALIKFLKVSNNNYEIVLTTNFSSRELQNEVTSLDITTEKNTVMLAPISNEWTITNENYMNTGYNTFTQFTTFKISESDLKNLANENIKDFKITGEHFNFNESGEVTIITPIKKGLWPSWNQDGIKTSINNLLNKSL